MSHITRLTHTTGVKLCSTNQKSSWFLSFFESVEFVNDFLSWPWNWCRNEISNVFWRVKPSYKWLLIIGDVYCCHIFVMRRCKLCSKLIFFSFFEIFLRENSDFEIFCELLNGLIRNRKRGRIIVNQIEFSITTFINLFNPHFKKWYFRNCIFLSRSWSVSRITVYTALYSSDMIFADISKKIIITCCGLLSFIELMLSSCWIFSHHWINAL